MAAIVPKMKGCPPITIHVSVPEHARDGVRKRFEVAGWTITFEGHYYAPDPYEWIVLRPQRAPTLLDALSAEVGGCNHPLVRSPERS